MPRRRQVRADASGEIGDLLEGEEMDNTKPVARKPGCMRSELRCQSGGAEFVGLSFSCHVVLSALEVH